jgi:hypothetical protein
MVTRAEERGKLEFIAVFDNNSKGSNREGELW